MSRIKVVNPNESWMGTEYYIDGKKINNVRSVDFRVAVDEVPCFAFETIGLPDIDMAGDIGFRFAPETVKQAVVVLRKELISNRDLRDAFLKSMLSAYDLVWAKRKFYINNTTPNRVITFEPCYYRAFAAGSSYKLANGTCIPLRIYGIKG